MVPLVPVTVTE
jgi:hypothetical protein